MVSTPQDERDRPHMSQHDPYRNMPGANTRPENILVNAEAEASQPTNSPSSININTKTAHSKNLSRHLGSAEAEQRSEHSFINSVTGRLQQSQKLKPTGIRGFKKVAPLALIASLLLGGGFFFYATQFLLAPHLSALYTQQTDLQFTSYSMRNSRLMSYMLDGGNQIKVSNFTKKYTTFTPYMKSRLAKNGIEVGYLDSSGKFQTDQIISNKSTVLRYNGAIIDANSFQDTYASNANFREAYYKAKRGRIAGFFDDTADKFYRNKGATRDIFNKFKSTGDAETDKSNFEKTVSNRVTGTNGTVNTARRVTDEETKEEYTDKNGSDLDTKNTAGDTPEAKARAFVNGLAGKVSNVGVPVCTALRIANLASVAVGAYQIAQSAAYFLSMMESVSKMMAGEGDASAVNETLNFLNTPTTQTVDYVNQSGQQTSTEVTGAPLESAGAKVVLGNTPVSESETLPYSINNITRAATRIAVGTGLTTTACSGVMAASAIISLAANAVPGGTLATFVVGAVAQTIGGIAITGAVALVINAILPQVVKMFATDVFETYTGVPAGNLFTEGAATANFQLSTQGSAYLPASEEYIKDQNRKTIIALASEAELERNERNPFDYTSDKTFLGSALSKLSFLNYSSNPLSVASNFLTSTRNASAADQDFSYTTNYQPCADDENMMCDMYGYPIPASDYSTIDLRPDDSNYLSAITPNLDDNNNIKDNSELAKFINFCVNRESPWFVTDANILNALQSDAGVVLNNVPILNDVIDLVNVYQDATNLDWATGKNCEISADNPRWDSEFKYYQRYVQDMRYLAGMEGTSFSGDASSLNSDGFSLEAAKAFMNEYKSLPSPQISDPWDIAANDFPHGCGESLANCVEFTLYFVNRYTKAHFSSLPDGASVVQRLLSSGQGFTDGGHTPKAYAIFSHNSGSHGGDGHTGVVLGIDVASNTIIIGEAGCGSGLDFIDAHTYDLSEWTNNPSITYAYTDNILVMSGNTALNQSNPVLAYEARYEAAHPKDNSLEGTLARISGMTTDDIAFLMELSDYTNFLANYDGSSRYAFYQTKPASHISFANIDNHDTHPIIIAHFPDLLFDKRNYLV